MNILVMLSILQSPAGISILKDLFFFFLCNHIDSHTEAVTTLLLKSVPNFITVGILGVLSAQQSHCSGQKINCEPNIPASTCCIAPPSALLFKTD